MVNVLFKREKYAGF